MRWVFFKLISHASQCRRNVDASVAVPDACPTNLLNPSFGAGLLAAARFVVIGGPIEFQDAARPPDRYAPFVTDRRRQLALTSRPQIFRRMTSRSISRSSDSSATVFFDLARSRPQSCFSRRISGSCISSYFFFQLK